MKAIDFFSGAGGASLGLHMAGIDLLHAFDFDADACATHRANIPSPVTCADLEAIDLHDLPDADLWWASPPCQAWSVAGKRKGGGDPRNLFPWALSAIEVRRPRWVAIENVPGLLSWDSGRYFGRIISRLEDAGYTVAHRVLNAVGYGVPQFRKRVFIVANLDGVRFWWPEPTHGDPAEIAPMCDTRRPWVTVRQALGIPWDAPSYTVTANKAKTPAASDVWKKRKASSILRIIAQRNATLDGHGDGSMVDEPSVTVGAGNPPRWVDRPAPTLAGATGEGGAKVYGGSGSMECWRRLGIDPSSILDTPSATIRVGSHGQPGFSPKHQGGYVPGGWREDSPDRPAQTIDHTGELHRAGRHDVPGQWGKGSTRLRRLSLAECAALQSFPPRFAFCGNTKTSRYRQIGNAVPPLLAWHIGNALMAAVGEEGTPVPDTLVWLRSPDFREPQPAGAP